MEITYILDKRAGKIIPHNWKSLISESLISEFYCIPIREPKLLPGICSPRDRDVVSVKHRVSCGVRCTSVGPWKSEGASVISMPDRTHIRSRSPRWGVLVAREEPGSMWIRRFENPVFVSYRRLAPNTMTCQGVWWRMNTTYSSYRSTITGWNSYNHTYRKWRRPSGIYVPVRSVVCLISTLSYKCYREYSPSNYQYSFIHSPMYNSYKDTTLYIRIIATSVEKLLQLRKIHYAHKNIMKIL